MIDMIKNAKDLIAKGKTLNDPELVQMGMDLLQEYDKKVIPTPNSQYVCSNCGHTMPVDKEGRKKCPKCKKNKLQITAIQNKSEPDFKMQIRNKTQSNTNDKKYTRPEPVTSVTNLWKDEEDIGRDHENEMLKQFTQISPRNRKPVEFKEVKCDQCGKIEKVHPLHVSNKTRYVCTTCLGRWSQR